MEESAELKGAIAGNSAQRGPHRRIRWIWALLDKQDWERNLHLENKLSSEAYQLPEIEPRTWRGS
jgi:hypothetical protein